LGPLFVSAAIVVYDITSHESFERAKQWIKELQRNGNADIVIALSGNKLDLADKRAVQTQEAQEYAEENGILFSETSAKTAANVNELFVAIGASLGGTRFIETDAVYLIHFYFLWIPPAKRLPKSTTTTVTPRRIEVTQAPAKESGGCCS
jgi:hypothetical protein